MITVVSMLRIVVDMSRVNFESSKPRFMLLGDIAGCQCSVVEWSHAVAFSGFRMWRWWWW